MTPLIRCPICHASWPKGSIQQCSHTDEEWRKYNNELSVPEGNQRATEKKIRALPTPAREIDREKLSKTICQAGKFETGEGTCAFICMDQMGDCRKAGCKHATAVHGRLADAILSLIGGRHV